MSTTTNTAARNAIDAAIEALMTRPGTTSDANEKATINKASSSSWTNVMH